MSSLPTVTDTELQAALAVLTSSGLVLPLDPEEMRRIAHAALIAAAEVRPCRLVRADGAVFQIGSAFSTGRALWRCTDIGTRSITAMRIDRVVTPRPRGEQETWATDQVATDPRKLPSWTNGPPYALAEFSFDEQDIETLEPVPREKVAVWDPSP
jgi:hypothetical protein